MPLDKNHHKGSYGVTRSFTRLADGSQKMTGLMATSPVNICPICKKVVDKLYLVKNRGVAMKICGYCRKKMA